MAGTFEEIEEINRNIHITDSLMEIVMIDENINAHNRIADENFNAEMKSLQEKFDEGVKRVMFDHEQTKLMLESHIRELTDRQAINDTEKTKLEKEKRMYERAICEHNKAHERMLKLVEEQKREREKVHQKIKEQQKELVENQRLEMQTEQLKRVFEVIKESCGPHVHHR